MGDQVPKVSYSARSGLKRKRITFALDRRLLAELKLQAEEERVSATSIVERALRKELKKEER